MTLRMRAVIDTNVWVSAFIGAPGAAFRIANAALGREFELIVSVPLLEELHDVLTRPAIARRHAHSLSQIAGFVDDLRSIAVVVDVAELPQGCRDPKDDVVIETALVGAAEILTTADEDFRGSPAVVDVLTRAGIRILTPSEFARELLALRPGDQET